MVTKSGPLDECAWVPVAVRSRGRPGSWDRCVTRKSYTFPNACDGQIGNKLINRKNVKKTRKKTPPDDER